MFTSAYANRSSLTSASVRRPSHDVVEQPASGLISEIVYREDQYDDAITPATFITAARPAVSLAALADAEAEIESRMGSVFRITAVEGYAD
jgi:cell division inhibitor SulA